MAAITPFAQLVAVLDALKTGDYGAVTMDLYQNDVDPTPSSVLGDFEVADFSGYAQATALDFGGVFQNLDGYAEMDLPSQQFDHSGGATANNIYGFFVEVTAGGLLYAERFPVVPIPMITAVNSIIVLSRFVLRNIGT